MPAASEVMPAARQPQITPTRFRSRAGIAGAVYLVLGHALDPDSVDRALQAGRSPFLTS